MIPARSAPGSGRATGLLAAAVPPLALIGALPMLGLLGVLRGPFLLVIALPILARALAALGWIDIAAAPFGRIRSAVGAVLATYLAWLGLSALLTLDVAAVVAVPVGLEVAARAGREGRSQVASGIVGSNVGSLLFPFSNLTNLVLVAGTGLAFVDFVRVAAAPQVLAALGAGLVLAVRARQLDGDPDGVVAPDDEQAAATAANSAASAVERPSGAAALAGMVSIVGAAVAVAVGLGGGDVALVLGVASVLVAAIALAARRTDLGGLAGTVPISAVAVILVAALLREPIAGWANLLPDPERTLAPVIALPVIALVGGGLSAIFNNLPAAAFGAVWLVGASPPAIVAYLIGTNVLALITPHGSVATMLGRTLAQRGGTTIGARSYLRRAWTYALAGAVPALIWLIVIR